MGFLVQGKKLLNFDDTIQDYGDAWMQLVCNENLNPSLRPEWMRCVSDAFGVTQQYKVFILLEGNVAVGFLPYYVTERNINGIKARALEIGGNLVSYHQELITSNHQVLLEQSLGYLTQHEKWDIAIINNVWSEGQTFRAITHQSHYNYSSYRGESSPYLPLKGDWKELLSSKRRKFRYKVNKREKELLDNPDIEIIWYSDDRYEELAEAIFQIEINSWKVAENMDITSRPTEIRYYKNLLPYMTSNGLLLANVLKIKGVPVAYNLCYEQNGMVGQIKTSFDDNYKELSPGAIIIEEALRKYFEMGFKEFDFLGDAMPHKQLWTKLYRNHFEITIYNNNLKGKIIYLYTKIRQAIKSRITKHKQ